MKQAHFETARLAALSDGVFAIAMTLLVLGLKLPALDAASATNDLPSENMLLQQLPHFLSWILSFAILARLWIVQHALLVGGGHRSRAFMSWNFMFLAAESFVPFATALIAERHDKALSTIVFSLTLVVGGIALERMWKVEQSFFIEQSKTNFAVISPRSSAILTLVVAVIACLIAIVSPRLAVGVWIAFPLVSPLLHRLNHLV